MVPRLLQREKLSDHMSKGIGNSSLHLRKLSNSLQVECTDHQDNRFPDTQLCRSHCLPGQKFPLSYIIAVKILAIPLGSLQIEIRISNFLIEIVPFEHPSLELHSTLPSSHMQVVHLSGRQVSPSLYACPSKVQPGGAARKSNRFIFNISLKIFFCSTSYSRLRLHWPRGCSGGGGRGGRRPRRGRSGCHRWTRRRPRWLTRSWIPWWLAR